MDFFNFDGANLKVSQTYENSTLWAIGPSKLVHPFNHFMLPSNHHKYSPPLQISMHNNLMHNAIPKVTVRLVILHKITRMCHFSKQHPFKSTKQPKMKGRLNTHEAQCYHRNSHNFNHCEERNYLISTKLLLNRYDHYFIEKQFVFYNYLFSLKPFTEICHYVNQHNPRLQHCKKLNYKNNETKTVGSIWHIRGGELCD